ncbi:hypothetical protein [Undibacterium danionis]|uniref:DUF423 domain-containing protein n=1 Tax=Undibacterium danionis TaxID=1812100 RepID=A0ABV6IEZ9_9BURK
MEKASWQRITPWFLMIASSIVIYTIGHFLIQNMEWFRANATLVISGHSENYQIHILHIHAATLKRLIGFFASFCLIFLGTGVSIYAVQNATKFSGEANSAKLSLVTTSPGIVAMLLGTVLMIYAVTSKDEFPAFDGSETNSASATTPGLERTVPLRGQPNENQNGREK